MRLVRLQFLVIGILDVDRPAPQLRHAVRKVIDHRCGGGLVAHLQEGLVLALEHEHVGDASEGDSQMDDLRLGDVVRNVADVDDPRGLAHVRLELHLRTKRRPT